MSMSLCRQEKRWTLRYLCWWCYLGAVGQNCELDSGGDLGSDFPPDTALLTNVHSPKCALWLNLKLNMWTFKRVSSVVKLWDTFKDRVPAGDSGFEGEAGRESTVRAPKVAGGGISVSRWWMDAAITEERAKPLHTHSRSFPDRSWVWKTTCRLNLGVPLWS